MHRNKKGKNRNSRKKKRKKIKNTPKNTHPIYILKKHICIYTKNTKKKTFPSNMSTREKKETKKNVSEATKPLVSPCFPRRKKKKISGNNNKA